MKKRPGNVWGRAAFTASLSVCLAGSLVAAPQSSSEVPFPAGLRVDGTNTFQPRAPTNDLEVQLALIQHHISPGSVDGTIGPQTHAALLTFQAVNSLPLTGLADALTRSNLFLQAPPLARYKFTAADLAYLQPVSRTWLGKSKQDRLRYETALEMAAEWSQTNPKLIRRLNPFMPWSNIVAGMELVVPNAGQAVPTEKAAFVRIFLSQRILQVYGEYTNLLAHFPCSIGRHAERRPVGRLQVAVIVQDPNYTFNPQIFADSTEGRQLNRKLIIPPGPNNPVGLIWIGLDRPGYGIHGTPEPEKVGRTESRGCFRLANWNAACLAKMAWVSMPVFVEP